MKPGSTLAFSGATHERVRRHLHKGDGLESAAILICTRVPGERYRLLVKDAILVPDEACTDRGEYWIRWPGAYIEAAIDAAEPYGHVLIAIHSHPGGLFGFSQTDDESDSILMPALFAAYGKVHGSAIMIPDGSVRARLYQADMRVSDVELVTVAGDDLHFWWSDQAGDEGPSARPMAFTSDMTRELGRLTAAVVGVSGTGSIVAEQLARLGFGRIILIDFDRVEAKNLNRILNSTLADVARRELKVQVFARAIEAYRGEGVAVAVPCSIFEREAVLAVAEADVLFSCVDVLDARQIADLLSAAFLLPLFDVGVNIPVHRDGESVSVWEVCGRIDYVQPGGSSLRDRGVYDDKRIRAEYLRRHDPQAHDVELQAGYLKGVVEEAPSVIALNARAASACVLEFVARTYPYRAQSNRFYARTEFYLSSMDEDHLAEDQFTSTDERQFAAGDAEPLLGLPALARKRG